MRCLPCSRGGTAEVHTAVVDTARQSQPACRRQSILGPQGTAHPAGKPTARCVLRSPSFLGTKQHFHLSLQSLSACWPVGLDRPAEPTWRSSRQPGSTHTAASSRSSAQLLCCSARRLSPGPQVHQTSKLGFNSTLMCGGTRLCGLSAPCSLRAYACRCRNAAMRACIMTVPLCIWPAACAPQQKQERLTQRVGVLQGIAATGDRRQWAGMICQAGGHGSACPHPAGITRPRPLPRRPECRPKMGDVSRSHARQAPPLPCLGQGP